MEREATGRAEEHRRAIFVSSPQLLACQPTRSGQHERGLEVQRKIPTRNPKNIFGRIHLGWLTYTFDHSHKFSKFLRFKN